MHCCLMAGLGRSGNKEREGKREERQEEREGRRDRRERELCHHRGFQKLAPVGTVIDLHVCVCCYVTADCAGGFPYLIGGKYAEDYGLVEESCNLYTGNVTGHCTTEPTCRRHYSTAYQYVGGYYGAYVLLTMISVTCYSCFI